MSAADEADAVTHSNAATILKSYDFLFIKHRPTYQSIL
jgi:hypothetical protein